MRKSALVLLLFSPFFSFSQDCDCVSKFKWVKETFEQNDAGFSHIINQKGTASYNNHTKLFLEKAQETNSNTACYELMRSWMTFFRKGHFGIRPLDQELSETIDNKEWETLNIDLEDFKTHLKNKKNKDYEGIWKSGPYVIGIKNINNEYKGFIIEANGSQWKKGEVKLVINPDNSSTYYMGDYSTQNFTNTELLGGKYLQLGFLTLEKTYPNATEDPVIERYYKSISSDSPYLERVNPNTLLLRIPSFDANQKQLIDSVLSVNHALITNTKNLLIDLRGNGGGSDRSFEEILPILYTGPIETVGVELFSTERNNERVKNFISHPNASPEFKEWATKTYDKLSKNQGEYVNVDSVRTTTTEFDTIYSYPKNVGIIVDGQNASSTEQFLLAAKQSTKVKLFGQTTFGALDISYTYPAKSPCGDFELIYCLSRSLRIPEMTIDDKGIHPDYYIYNEVPKYEWIEFAVQKLN